MRFDLGNNPEEIDILTILQLGGGFKWSITDIWPRFRKHFLQIEGSGNIFGKLFAIFSPPQSSLNILWPEMVGHFDQKLTGMSCLFKMPSNDVVDMGDFCEIVDFLFSPFKDWQLQLQRASCTSQVCQLEVG